MDLIATNFDKEIVNIRSHDCNHKVKVRFHNFTDKVVELLWINFTGKEERYILLRPNQFVDIDTYINHYWIARDVHTGDPMRISKQFIYNISEFIKGCKPDFPLNQLPLNKRFTLKIMLPVYSLRYTSMLIIRDCVDNECKVEKLEIPDTLKENIIKLIERKKLKGMKRMT